MTLCRLASIALTFLTLLPLACSSTEKQLKRVAKDWCMTIRASQVIPVYPLTEDLQPGDVFLVEVPQNEQHEIYEDRGFLPLDHLLTRLDSVDYRSMYADAYWEGTFGAGLPNDRPMWELGADIDGDGLPDPTFRDTVLAPRAAFPSYTFRVRRGTSFGAALPIQGIPVALSFMKSSSANGSVTISDAYTYAAQPEALVASLRKWASRQGPRNFLRELGAATASGAANGEPGKSAYVRVVQRVYLTGGIVVSVTNTETRGSGLSAGASDARDISILEVQDAATLDNYNRTSEALSAALEGSENPGGSIQLVEASERAVSLKENFDRPLVVGYLGLDFRVDANGELVGPISTLNVIEKRESAVSAAIGSSYLAPPTQEASVLRESILDWITGRSQREVAVNQSLRERCGYDVGVRQTTLALGEMTDMRCLQEIADAHRIPVIPEDVRAVRRRIELWLLDNPGQEAAVLSYLTTQCGVSGTTTGIALRELTERTCMDQVVAQFSIRPIR